LFGTTRGSVSCFLLSRNWRYWLAELRIQSICQTDILTMSLPKRLLFVYPLLRVPLWFWRHAMHRIVATESALPESGRIGGHQ
jgi:hypothetical protein